MSLPLESRPDRLHCNAGGAGQVAVRGIRHPFRLPQAPPRARAGTARVHHRAASEGPCRRLALEFRPRSRRRTTGPRHRCRVLPTSLPAEPRALPQLLLSAIHTVGTTSHFPQVGFTATEVGRPSRPNLVTLSSASWGSPKVAIAGATGFVGAALCEALVSDFDIVGLSRGERENDAVEWRRCDLYSLLDVERGLEGCDYAIYLVHSMLPSARLTQASFEDLDLVLADNFARAAAGAGVKQILYLGGLIPAVPRSCRSISPPAWKWRRHSAPMACP